MVTVPVAMPNDHNSAPVVIAIPAAMLSIKATIMIAVMVTVATYHDFFGIRGRRHRQRDGDRAESRECDDEFTHLLLLGFQLRFSCDQLVRWVSVPTI